MVGSAAPGADGGDRWARRASYKEDMMETLLGGAVATTFVAGSLLLVTTLAVQIYAVVRSARRPYDLISEAVWKRSFLGLIAGIVITIGSGATMSVLAG
jgi:hypothetical protein